jgi:hypothetical protein
MVWPTVSFGSLEVKDIVEANLKDVLRNVSIVFCESIGSKSNCWRKTEDHLLRFHPSIVVTR